MGHNANDFIAIATQSARITRKLQPPMESYGDDTRELIALRQ